MLGIDGHDQRHGYVDQNQWDNQIWEISQSCSCDDWNQCEIYQKHTCHDDQNRWG